MKWDTQTAPLLRYPERKDVGMILVSNAISNVEHTSGECELHS